MPTKTREEWLVRVVSALRPKFRKAGLALPKTIGVACGWPSEGGLRRVRVDGECWTAATSEAERPEIFLSPVMADGVEVAAVLVHELIHAVKPEAAHGTEFRRAMLPLGLIGKATESRPGEELKRELAAIIKKIGPYPHARIKPGVRHSKPQTTRLLKAACPECGYTIRVTAKWVEVGLPTCVCGTTFEADGEAA